MKILQIHNSYKYFGGEDSVVDEEYKLLKSKGHDIVQLIRHNKIETNSLAKKLKVLKNLSYSSESVKLLKKNFDNNGYPNLVHIHNTFPLWSYSIIEYLNSINLPIIFTLHNYRIIWEDLSPFDKSSMLYGPYKNSLLKSYLISKLLNKKKNLLRYVDIFITHTKFTKKIFIKHGFSEKKLIIKPNFLKLSKNEIKNINQKKKIIYASRISKEKGILTLLKAWTKININLDILGDGPLLKKLKQTKLKNVNFYGNLDRVNVCDHINKATAIVFPSEWYESFPMTILEAFREGTIVIASNIGSIKYIIKDMYNGILFEPGNYKDLRSKIEWVIQNQEKSDKISQNALQEFKQKYSPEVNYNQLISIYKNAITKKN